MKRISQQWKRTAKGRMWYLCQQARYKILGMFLSVNITSKWTSSFLINITFLKHEHEMWEFLEHFPTDHFSSKNNLLIVLDNHGKQGFTAPCKRCKKKKKRHVGILKWRLFICFPETQQCISLLGCCFFYQSSFLDTKSSASWFHRK